MLEKSERLTWLSGGLRSPLILGIIVLFVVGGGGIYIKQQQAAKQAAKERLIAVVEPKTVTALGKLEPKGEIIKLSAPT
jgi:HlyD family secretion protein